MERFPDTVPGQFLQIRCAEEHPVTDHEVRWPADGFPSLGAAWREPRAFLRRPFSIADDWREPDGGAHLLVLVHVVGPGTRWLARRRQGEPVNLTGPLGRGFSLPARDTPVVLVGGGVGIPPLLYLSRRLSQGGHSDVTVIFGATTRARLPVALRGQPASDGTPRPCVDLPAGAAFPAIVTTDDGSLGLPGIVTDGLTAWWKRRKIRPAAGARVYACGPEPMLRAVARVTRRLGLDCELCIERQMGCGLGACLSCVVRRRDPAAPQGWRWALACQEGPVFERDELLDDDLPAGP